jgi:hypothetical protein
MMTFKIDFHRYSSAHGSRISAPRFIQAEDFHSAYKTAELMASAMKEADTANDYIIASIETHGLRGDVCSNGWETDEEFSARVAKETGYPPKKAETVDAD